MADATVQTQQQSQQQQRLNEFSFPSYETKDHEGLEQVFENLLKFQQSIEVIDGQVNQQHEQYKKRLEEIINRIDVCRRKIVCLNKVQTAMAFHSPNRFIKQHRFMENPKRNIFQTMKKNIVPTRLDPRQSPLMYHDPKLHGKQPDTSRDDLVQMFLYTSYKFQQKRRNIFDGKNSITNNQHTLIDNPPRDLKYVESFMVFNSNVNPYKSKKKVPNLEVQQNKAKKEKTDEQQIKLYDAPNTLKEQERLVKYEAQVLDYVPTHKDAPVFNLDQGLNEFGFGNIVDLQFDLGEQNIFAPSKDVFSKNIIPEPQFQPNQSSTTQIPQTTFQAIQNLTNQQQQQQPNQVQQQQPQQLQPYQSQAFNNNPSQPQQLQQAPNNSVPQNNFQQQQQQPIQNNQPFNNQAPMNPNNQPPNLTNLMNNNTPQAPNLTNLMNNNTPQAPNLTNLMNNNTPQAPNLTNLMNNPQAPNNLNGQGPPPLGLLQQQQVTQQPMQQPQQMQQPPAGSSAGGGGRSALLDQIRNPGIRLKKRVTKETGVDPKPDKAKGEEGPKAGPTGGLSMMDHLKKQIAMRHLALNPKPPNVKKVDEKRRKGKESDDEGSEEEQQDD